MTTRVGDTVAPLLDEQSVAALLADLGAASSTLARSPDVAADVRDFIAQLPRRLRADAPMHALAGDPYLAENAYAGAARAAAALLRTDDDEAVEVRREVRLALEQVRQALRDLEEARPVDEDAPIEQVVAWLESTFALPQKQVAEVVGTSLRTWQRWLKGEARPDPAQTLRLRRMARLTRSVRHALTGPGAARWFTRQHPLIRSGGGSPAELLTDDDGYRHLLALAAGLRSTQAS